MHCTAGVCLSLLADSKSCQVNSGNDPGALSKDRYGGPHLILLHCLTGVLIFSSSILPSVLLKSKRSECVYRNIEFSSD